MFDKQKTNDSQNYPWDRHAIRSIKYDMLKMKEKFIEWSLINIIKGKNMP